VYFGNYEGLVRRLEINAKTLCIGEVETWLAHSSRVYCSTWDGSLLYTGSADNTVRVWNVANGSCFHVKVITIVI
jgi:WD40 repeat protein